MKVVVNGATLRDHFNKILTVVDKKNSRPILAHCMVVATPDYLELVATDLEVAAKVRVPAQIEKTGAFCINAKNFFDILREMPNDSIHLELDEEKNLLKLRCNEIYFSLLIFKADDFPQLSFEGKNGKFKLNSSVFQLIIGKISHAISQDETRPFLSALYLEQLESSLRAVATDSHRLALISVPTEQEENPILQGGIIIPKKGVSEIKKLSDYCLDEDLEVAVDNSFIYISSGDRYFLSVRLIARDYLPFESVISIRTLYKMTVEKNPLLNSAKRIKTLASERSNGIKFSLCQDELILSANRPSLGDASETIPIKYDGPDLDISFNAKYLIEVLSIFEAGEVVFEFGHDAGPIHVRSSELPSFLGVIMPIKL